MCANTVDMLEEVPHGFVYVRVGEKEYIVALPAREVSDEICTLFMLDTVRDSLNFEAYKRHWSN